MLSASGYISVEEFKFLNPHLDLSLYSDATISGLIHLATQRVDDFLGYTLPIEDIESERIPGAINSEGDLEVWVTKIPIEEVKELRIVRGTLSITLALEADGKRKYHLPENFAPPILYPSSEFSVEALISPFNLRRGWFFEVSYRAGYESVPAPVKMATSYLVKEMMAERFNPGGFENLSEGSVRLSRSVFSQEAEALLRSYRRLW